MSPAEWMYREREEGRRETSLEGLLCAIPLAELRVAGIVVRIEGVNDGFGSVAAMPPLTRLAPQVTCQRAPRLWGSASPGSLAES